MNWRIHWRHTVSKICNVHSIIFKTKKRFQIEAYWLITRFAFEDAIVETNEWLVVSPKLTIHAIKIVYYKPGNVSTCHQHIKYRTPIDVVVHSHHTSVSYFYRVLAAKPQWNRWTQTDNKNEITYLALTTNYKPLFCSWSGLFQLPDGPSSSRFHLGVVEC